MIALGLASASEQRLGGERILHGFLAPHLVMISNEGETRLLGFEISPALRGFAGNPVVRQHFGRYLAPEALGLALARLYLSYQGAFSNQIVVPLDAHLDLYRSA